MGSTRTRAWRGRTGSSGYMVERGLSSSPAATGWAQLSHSPAHPSARQTGQLPRTYPSTRYCPVRGRYGNVIVRARSFPAACSRSRKPQTVLVNRSSTPVKPSTPIPAAARDASTCRAERATSRAGVVPSRWAVVTT